MLQCRKNFLGQNQARTKKEACASSLNANSGEEYNHINESKGDIRMKIGLYIIGTLLILGGAIWVLQGVNILPGSFMTGQIKWAINGTISIVIGAGLILFGRNRK
jgi:hypothetical protein